MPRPDPEREGERWLIGAEQPSAMLLARWAVPQLGARVYDLVARAVAGDPPSAIAAAFGISQTETLILVAHWSPLPRAATRVPPARRSFLELSLPTGDR